MMARVSEQAAETRRSIWRVRKEREIEEAIESHTLKFPRVALQCFKIQGGELRGRDRWEGV